MVIWRPFSSFNYHLILKRIALRKGSRISVVSITSETYITFTWTINILNTSVQFRFIDSYKFLSMSLSNIIDSMDSFPYFQKFCHKYFPDLLPFDREILAKPAMCYEYLTYETLKEISFPDIDKFHSTLTGETVSREFYERGLSIFKKIKCQTLYDYLNFYLIWDILFLTDACEAFRDLMMEFYSIDPFQYFTLASFSLDLVLYYSKKSIPLMTDVNMILMTQSAIRGGLTFGTKELTKSNSRWSKNYVKEEKETQIVCLDVVGLYGYCMSKFLLPFGEYEWITEEKALKQLERDILRISPNAPYGFLIRYDISYPESLHDSHNNCPLLSENIDLGKVRKLCSTLNDKTGYQTF